MKASKELLRFTVLSVLLAAPALHAADNCGGFYSSEGVYSETVDMANGIKITYFTAHNTTSSGNSAYNGVGGCAGYAHALADGKGWVSGSCTLVSPKGDSWSYSFFEDFAAGGKGAWKGVTGTGAFSANEKSGGWYQSAAAGGKTAVGAWGGTCVK
jgi:hypothetical protein